MSFKKIINKVKDTHSQIKEKLEQEKKLSVKNEITNIDKNNTNVDGLKIDESSKKGIGLKEDIFIHKIEAIETVRQKSYKVEKGDTLKSISVKFFDTPNKWIMLHNANIHKIPNPYKLIDGMVLKIPDETEFENFYYEVSKKGNYIVQPEDNINSITEKIFSSKEFVKKLLQWNYFKYTKDIYPGKEVENLKYKNLEYQLEKLISKYNLENKNCISEQSKIILSSVAHIARENKVPPVVMMVIADINNYWQNSQISDQKNPYNGDIINWQPMLLNDSIYKDAFPRAAMEIEFNIIYSANVLRELRKNQKNWPKAIVSFYLDTPIGIGKPEEQKGKSVKGIEIIDRILKNMENKEFSKSVKSRITKDDEHDITYEILYAEISRYKDFIKEKYL